MTLAFTRWLFLLGILLATGDVLMAQTITVTGRVSAGNAPLPGVNVSLDGTSTGTTTGADGTYRLNTSGKTRRSCFRTLVTLPSALY